MTRSLRTIRAAALKAALALGLLGTAAAMSGCSATEGALWGAFTGALLGAPSDHAAAGAIIGAGVGAAIAEDAGSCRRVYYTY